MSAEFGVKLSFGVVDAVPVCSVSGSVLKPSG